MQNFPLASDKHDILIGVIGLSMQRLLSVQSLVFSSSAHNNTIYTIFQQIIDVSSIS